MIEYLFKTLIGKGLPVAVTWASVSLSMLGIITANDVQFGSTGLISCKSFDVNLSWHTVLNETIEVDSVNIKDLRVKTFIEDPLHVVRCLQGADCGSAFVSKMPVELKSGRSPHPASNKVVGDVFKALIHSVNVESGELLFVQESYSLTALVNSATVKNVYLPLSEQAIDASLDLAVSDPSGRVHNLKVKLLRPKGSQKLVVDVFVEKFPIEVIAPLFLEDSQTSGLLSGKLHFEYQDSKWKLPMQLRFL